MADIADIMQRIIAAEKAKAEALSEAERLSMAISAALDVEDADAIADAVDKRQPHVDRVEAADNEAAMCVRSLPADEKEIVTQIYAVFHTGEGNMAPSAKDIERGGELEAVLAEQRAVLDRLAAHEAKNRGRMEKLLERLRSQIEDMKKNRGIMDKYLPDNTLPAGTVYFEKK